MTSLIVAVTTSVLVLVAVIWSGAAHRRPLHYALVVAFFLALGVAIWRAKLVGQGLVFEGTAATIHSIHNGVVTMCTGTALGLLITGVRLARAPAVVAASRRKLHRGLAGLFVLLVLAAAGLGTAMTVLARPAP